MGTVFFRCLSYVISGKEIHYKEVRRMLAHHIRCIEVLLQRVFRQKMTAQEYLQRRRMDVDKTWATEIELFAMAHFLKTDIYVYALTGQNFQWLKHSGAFLQEHLEIDTQCIYLFNREQNHYDVVLDVHQSIDLTALSNSFTRKDTS